MVLRIPVFIEWFMFEVVEAFEAIELMVLRMLTINTTMAAPHKINCAWTKMTSWYNSRGETHKNNFRDQILAAENVLENFKNSKNSGSSPLRTQDGELVVGLVGVTVRV